MPWVRTARSRASPPAIPLPPLVFHRGETAHIKAGAERASLPGQYYRAQAFLAAKPLRGCDKRLEHRGIKRIHLVGADHADVGNPARDRHLHAIIHDGSLPVR
jgi:hypothetical protein